MWEPDYVVNLNEFLRKDDGKDFFKLLPGIAYLVEIEGDSSQLFGSD